jgi:hypothetical protein
MKKKLLPWLIALSALSVSGSAAFYSVSGLGKMFAGAATQVMVLAGSLELAKLVTASLLYQYWKQLNSFLKIYLSIATLILILITSAGIYGFLSSAYQETAFKVQNQDKNIEILDKDISMMQTEIKNYESRISQKDSRLAQLTTIRTNLQSTQDVLIEKSKSTTAVRKQITDIDSEIKRMDSEISSMNDSISSKNVKIGEIERNKLGVASNSDLAKEVGPLKYIANLTGKSLEQVVNWYIIVLMLVFDPLAIALVIAANFAFEKSKDEDTDQPNDINEDKEKKEIKMKKIWNKMKNMLNIFKSKKTITQEQIINDPIEHEELIIENIIEEEKILDIEIPTEEVKINEVVMENPIEPNIILEENKEEVENKVEEKDKYKDSNLSIEKQKMLRERFRNNPGSDPLKLR